MLVFFIGICIFFGMELVWFFIECGYFVLFIDFFEGIFYFLLEIDEVKILVWIY